MHGRNPDQIKELLLYNTAQLFFFEVTVRKIIFFFINLLFCFKCTRNYLPKGNFLCHYGGDIYIKCGGY
ncbi:TPA: hypothetical protein MI627_17680 [Klebsiella pneumoniae]|nr:hypothetical protein D0887_03120 [Klebsiella pneumoniae]OKB58665.1 hypothetical protein A9F07_15125 [Klebsiella pneumoniae]HBY7283514.1 hypothetical protein [Klebsiella pneumoniae]